MHEVLAKTDVSHVMNKQLKQDGLKFVGSTICYVFMQAVGMGQRPPSQLSEVEGLSGPATDLMPATPTHRQPCAGTHEQQGGARFGDRVVDLCGVAAYA